MSKIPGEVGIHRSVYFLVGLGNTHISILNNLAPISKRVTPWYLMYTNKSNKLYRKFQTLRIFRSLCLVLYICRVGGRRSPPISLLSSLLSFKRAWTHCYKIQWLFFSSNPFFPQHFYNISPNCYPKLYLLENLLKIFELDTHRNDSNIYQWCNSKVAYWHEHFLN